MCAQKEYMMAGHIGIDNKVYRVHKKAAFCIFWLLVVTPLYLIKTPLINYICISPPDVWGLHSFLHDYLYFNLLF